MGWNGIAGRHDTDQQKKIIRRRMREDAEIVRHEVVEDSGIHVHYLAVKTDGLVSAVVVLAENGVLDETYWDAGQPVTWYKWLDESEGPKYYDASEDLIRLLNKPAFGYADQWREKCLA